MKVLHVTPSFHPAVAWGGPITALYSLCNALAKRTDLSLRVLTTDSAGPCRHQRIRTDHFPESYKGYDVYFCRRWWGNEVSPKLIGMLRPMVGWADVVHVTATYSFPVIPTLAMCSILRRPIVWSPRGALQTWESHHRRNIKKLWNLICRKLAPSTFLFHCTSAKEAEETVRTFGAGRAVVVPNGVEIPEAQKQFPDISPRPLRLMFLGLISPKKGLDRLVDALRILKTDDFRLDIYGGPAPGYETYFQKLRAYWESSPVSTQIAFHGFASGDQKTAAFLKADVCVVPSHSENFCNTVAEALAHGLPVVVSRGVPWPRIEEIGCGRWVDNTPAALADCLQSFLHADLAVMGLKGRRWMTVEYSWERMAQELYQHYSSLLP